MDYSLNHLEVKRVIDLALNDDKVLNGPQFLYYHLNRNEFNVKDDITKLKGIGYSRYVDNKGRRWRELPTYFNKYHMPKEEYDKTKMPFNTLPKYSRKFVSDDDVSGIGGEFEMIIRTDGKRIDALTNAEYQETYNFARTLFHPINHDTLDVKPHFKNSNYAFKKNMGYVEIIEEESFSERIKKIF